MQTQIGERESAMPLRERVREIFKEHGVTLTTIFLAAGITIGAVVGILTQALKASGKALGNGLKDIGLKLGSILPGLIGSIVSFLFKTAGQAIGFLAEHTWLLILAAVFFIFEKYRKDLCISRTFLLKFWAKNRGCGLYTRPLLSDRVNWLVVVTN